ncbi:MAG TPA: hypothetical protein VLV78_07190 [Thermoanaerobaculia bacterium]|nr:hypothetical protein [Thermoanaerobaculia bacterium]
MKRLLISLAILVTAATGIAADVGPGGCEMTTYDAAFLYRGPKWTEAQQLADNDPAVKAGRLRIELHPWYAAKGIRVDPPVPQR